LLNIICLSLDADPKLIPRSAKLPPRRSSSINSEIPKLKSLSTISTAHEPDVPLESPLSNEEGDGDQKEEEDLTNPDDFTLMDEKQAKRIVSLASMSFGVELSPDVVIADANVGALARRVLGARSLAGSAG